MFSMCATHDDDVLMRAVVGGLHVFMVVICAVCAKGVSGNILIIDRCIYI